MNAARNRADKRRKLHRTGTRWQALLALPMGPCRAGPVS